MLLAYVFDSAIFYRVRVYVAKQRHCALRDCFPMWRILESRTRKGTFRAEKGHRGAWDWPRGFYEPWKRETCA